MRLTPGHPESTHCQERFRNPPELHTAGAQGPRLPPEQQPGKSHWTPTHPKRPRMSDSAQLADIRVWQTLGGWWKVEDQSRANSEMGKGPKVWQTLGHDGGLYVYV